MTKGKGAHQRNTRNQNVDAIKRALAMADNGLTKMEIHKMTKVSRPTIDLLLDTVPVFKGENVKHLEKRIYWTENYRKRLGDQFCHTWIGKVPISFSKTIEGMQSHLAWEKRLRERQSEAISKLRDEIEKSKGRTTASNWKYFEARVADEVGWSLGDYLEKILEKMQKEKGIRKIMTLYGITEDMLERMNAEQRKLADEQKKESTR